MKLWDFNFFSKKDPREEEGEKILKSLPKDKEQRARELITSLKDIRTFGNLNDYYYKQSELNNLLKSAITVKNPVRRKDGVQLIDAGTTEYNPAMSSLYQLFHNPLAVFAFIVKHHPAVHSAINVIREEVANDGFILRAEKGMTKKRLKEVYRVVKKHNIGELRVRMAAQLKIYGNIWVRLNKDTGSIKLFAPTKLLPVIDTTTDKIKAWDFIQGSKTTRYSYDDLLHLYLYSADDYSGLGDPPLGPALVDIEADMCASAFNNQVFRKGGLMGIILSIEPPNAGDPLADDPDDLVEEIQDRIDAQFSGARTGQSVLVGTGIKNVYNVSPIGKLDSSFQTLRMETAKTIATCLGVPPEKISISRSSTLQYIPSLVEDSVNASFDKSIYTLVEKVDDFINEKIMKEFLKIHDVVIEAGGRYGALTKNAAETLKTLAESGPIITVNDGLERILGWEALPPDNPRGMWVLDNTRGRSVGEKSSEAPRYPELVDPEKPNFEVGKSMTSDPLLDYIKTGAYEYIDNTYSEDSEIVHFAKIRRGLAKYFTYPKFVRKKVNEENLYKKSNQDEDSQKE